MGPDRMHRLLLQSTTWTEKCGMLAYRSLEALKHRALFDYAHGLHWDCGCRNIRRYAVHLGTLCGLPLRN